MIDEIIVADDNIFDYDYPLESGKCRISKFIP